MLTTRASSICYTTNVCSIPDIKYASKMREKTKSYVLSVDLDDPSTSTGITDVVRKILPYIPVVSKDGHVRKKTCLMGESRTCARQSVLWAC